MKPRQGLPRASEAQMDILNVLWDRGPSTVRQIHDELSRVKASQYTTTLKLMQVMTAKGLLERQELDRSHVYSPRIDRARARRELAGELMDRLFQGSAPDLLISALDAKRATSRELEDMRQIIESYQQQTAKARKGNKR